LQSRRSADRWHRRCPEQPPGGCERRAVHGNRIWWSSSAEGFGIHPVIRVKPCGGVRPDGDLGRLRGVSSGFGFGVNPETRTRADPTRSVHPSSFACFVISIRTHPTASLGADGASAPSVRCWGAFVIFAHRGRRCDPSPGVVAGLGGFAMPHDRLKVTLGGTGQQACSSRKFKV